MREWIVITSHQFENELKNIHDYISGTLLEPLIAKRFTNKVLDRIRGLSFSPERFPVYERKMKSSEILRFLPIDNFIMFFTVNEDTNTVLILHIFYSGRNVENCLEDQE